MEHFQQDRPVAKRFAACYMNLYVLAKLAGQFLQAAIPLDHLVGLGPGGVFRPGVYVTALAAGVAPVTKHQAREGPGSGFSCVFGGHDFLLWGQVFFILSEKYNQVWL